MTEEAEHEDPAAAEIYRLRVAISFHEDEIKKLEQKAKWHYAEIARYRLKITRLLQVGLGFGEG